MRTYRTAATVAVAVGFFALANLLLVLAMGGASPAAGDPEHEAWLLYYAIAFADDYPEAVPAALDQPGLRALLAELHPDAARLADRFEVVSYTRQRRGFQLVVEHVDGGRYRVTLGGVSHV